MQVDNLAKHYPLRRGLLSRAAGAVRAVDGLGFTLARGETLALVGESGCGKSTTARLVLRLIEPTAGTVRFEGQDITAMAGAPLRAVRRRMQIVFQDPFASLNPRMTVGQILDEPLFVHAVGNARTRRARVAELLELVGLRPDQAARYPHEFSGGQRQRIGIARALAVEPALVVLDEPVSALDVSIQAQVVNLLDDLQRRLGLSYLFIAHDLAVVKHVADRVAVMYLGRIVEVGGKQQVFDNPRHPYTRVLMAAIPRPDPHRRLGRQSLDGLGRQSLDGLGRQSADGPSRQPLDGRTGGDLPSPANIPPGCRFHTRCAFTIDRCRTEDPVLRAIEPAHPGAHYSACHRAEDLPAAAATTTHAMPPNAARRLALYAERRAVGAAPVSAAPVSA